MRSERVPRHQQPGTCQGRRRRAGHGGPASLRSTWRAMPPARAPGRVRGGPQTYRDRPLPAGADPRRPSRRVVAEVGATITRCRQRRGPGHLGLPRHALDTSGQSRCRRAEVTCCTVGGAGVSSRADGEPAGGGGADDDTTTPGNGLTTAPRHARRDRSGGLRRAVPGVTWPPSTPPAWRRSGSRDVAEDVTSAPSNRRWPRSTASNGGVVASWPGCTASPPTSSPVIYRPERGPTAGMRRRALLIKVPRPDLDGDGLAEWPAVRTRSTGSVPASGGHHPSLPRGPVGVDAAAALGISKPVLAVTLHRALRALATRKSARRNGRGGHATCVASCGPLAEQVPRRPDPTFALDMRTSWPHGRIITVEPRRSADRSCRPRPWCSPSPPPPASS